MLFHFCLWTVCSGLEPDHSGLCHREWYSDLSSLAFWHELLHQTSMFWSYQFCWYTKILYTVFTNQATTKTVIPSSAEYFIHQQQANAVPSTHSTCRLIIPILRVFHAYLLTQLHPLFVTFLTCPPPAVFLVSTHFCTHFLLYVPMIIFLVLSRHTLSLVWSLLLFGV